MTIKVEITEVIETKNIKAVPCPNYKDWSRTDLIAETKKKFPKLTAKQINNNSNEGLAFRLRMAWNTFTW